MTDASTVEMIISQLDDGIRHGRPYQNPALLSLAVSEAERLENGDPVGALQIHQAIVRCNGGKLQLGSMLYDLPAYDGIGRLQYRAGNYLDSFDAYGVVDQIFLWMLGTEEGSTPIDFKDSGWNRQLFAWLNLLNFGTAGLAIRTVLARPELPAVTQRLRNLDLYSNLAPTKNPFFKTDPTQDVGAKIDALEILYTWMIGIDFARYKNPGANADDLWAADRRNCVLDQITFYLFNATRFATIVELSENLAANPRVEDDPNEDTHVTGTLTRRAFSLGFLGRSGDAYTMLARLEREVFQPLEKKGRGDQFLRISNLLVLSDVDLPSLSKAISLFVNLSRKVPQGISFSLSQFGQFFESMADRVLVQTKTWGSNLSSVFPEFLSQGIWIGCRNEGFLDRVKQILTSPTWSKNADPDWRNATLTEIEKHRASFCSNDHVQNLANLVNHYVTGKREGWAQEIQMELNSFIHSFGPSGFLPLLRFALAMERHYRATDLDTLKNQSWSACAQLLELISQWKNAQTGTWGVGYAFDLESQARHLYFRLSGEARGFDLTPLKLILPKKEYDLLSKRQLEDPSMLSRPSTLLWKKIARAQGWNEIKITARVEKLLGTGGTSSVFLVRPIDGPLPQETVAVKVLKGGNETFERVKLLRELDRGHTYLFAQVPKGTGLPAMYGVCLTPSLLVGETVSLTLDRGARSPIERILHFRKENLAIIMEYVSGASLLDAVIRSRTRPDAVWILRNLLAPCRGLATLHAQKWIHQDIKPENIAAPENGLWKMLDFGSARHTEFGTKDKYPGTTLFVPPECISPEGEDFGEETSSPASDVWAFAATIFLCLFGRTPHGFDYQQYLDAKERGENPKKNVARWLHSEDGLRSFRCPAFADMPETGQRNLQSLLEKALAFVPGHRHPNAHALLSDLEQLLSQIPPERGSR